MSEKRLGLKKKKKKKPQQFQKENIPVAKEESELQN